VGRIPRMEVLLWHEVLVIPFVKISYLVPLRTGMSSEPAHRTHRAHHSFLYGQELACRLARAMPLLLGCKQIVQGGKGWRPTPS